MKKNLLLLAAATLCLSAIPTVSFAATRDGLVSRGPSPTVYDPGRPLEPHILPWLDSDPAPAPRPKPYVPDGHDVRDSIRMLENLLNNNR